MRGTDKQSGFSLVSVLIALSIFSVTAVVASNALSNYVKNYHAAMNQSLSRELRSTTVSMLYQTLSVFAAKRCLANSTLINYDPRIQSLSEALIKKHGLNRVQRMSFNDIAIQSEFGGGMVFGRPQNFSHKSDGQIDKEYAQSLQRCNSYPLSLSNTATTFNGCFEVSSKSRSDKISGFKSLYDAEKGLIEYRLEFVDTMDLRPLACDSLYWAPRAGVVIKMLLFWQHENSMRRTADVVTISM